MHVLQQGYLPLTRKAIHQEAFLKQLMIDRNQRLFLALLLALLKTETERYRLMDVIE